MNAVIIKLKASDKQIQKKKNITKSPKQKTRKEKCRKIDHEHFTSSPHIVIWNEFVLLVPIGKSQNATVSLGSFFLCSSFVFIYLFYVFYFSHFCCCWHANRTEKYRANRERSNAKNAQTFITYLTHKREEICNNLSSSNVYTPGE